MYPSRKPSTLNRFFAGLAESTFQSHLGVCDPALVGYLTDLLVRFSRTDTVYHVRQPMGRRVDQVVDMLIEAEQRVGDARRALYRHIGDFILFWSGVYPEALPRMQGPLHKDALVDYTEQGKRSYDLASRMRTRENEEECDVLHRLSREFELCVFGLGEIRREWQRRDDDEGSPSGPLWIN